MKKNVLIVALLASLGQAAEPRSEFAIGRAYYTAGEFKNAGPLETSW